MADQDTDRWVFEVLAPDLRRQMKNLKDKIQWTDLVYVFLLCLELFSETKNTALNHSVRLIPVELHANKSKTVFVSCHLSVPFLPPFSSLSKKNSSTPLPSPPPAKKKASSHDSSCNQPQLKRQNYLSLSFQLQLHLHLYHSQLQKFRNPTTTTTTTAFNPLHRNHHQSSNMARRSFGT